MARRADDREGWSEVTSASRLRRRRYRLEPAGAPSSGRQPASARTAIESGPQGTRSQRLRRRRKAKRVFIAALVTFVVILGALAAAGYAFLNDVGKDMQQDAKTDPKVEKALTAPVKHEPFTILMMGVDGRPSDPQQRTDTMIVARVDPDQRKVWMISIPRDTRVRIEGHGTRKINAANAFGGPALAVETVQDFLGIPINHYITTNLSGFKHVVDAMGGVWINVDVEIDDKKAAAANPGHRGHHIEPGYQLLDGEQALVYVRSRDFKDGDFTRMKHQQTFFKAVAQQSIRFGNVFKLPKVIRQMSRYTSTDMGVGELVSLGRQMRGIGDKDIQTATLAGEWRNPFVYTDEELKERLVYAFKTGGDLESTSTPVGGPTVDPEDVSVTVRNGAGIAGVAGECATRLTDAGFSVGEVGNANQFVYAETLVVYKSDVSAAQAVADTLGQGRLVESRGMYAFSADVLVMVGKDWGKTPTPTREQSSQ